MDSPVQDSVAAERREFLARLRTDPRFLLRHVPALSHAVYRRLRNRLIIALASAHRGRKRRPDWLGAGSAVRAGDCPETLTAGHLPPYPMAAAAAAAARISPQRPAAALETAADAPSDPENHFAEHRWGFLLQALLEGPVDWRGALQTCCAWVERNADRRQLCWEPYSAGERLTNLCVFLAAMPAPLRAQTIAPSLVRFLHESVEWIFEHLEYYGPRETNNHILANAKALAVGGATIGNAAAIAAAGGIFKQWLPRLVLDGGFLRERSSHYQLIVLNWLLDAGHFLSRPAGPQSEEVLLLNSCIARMLDAAGMLCDDAGRLLALVGDVSPDATPDQSAGRLERLYPDRWPVAAARRPPVELRDGWFRLGAAQDTVLGNFPPGRHPPAFPTHGHCDFTSFTWVHRRMAVLVDPGRYRYTGDPVSLSQLSALSHSLPTINGFAPLCESLVVNGQWWPLPYAAAVLEASERDGGLLLVHSGFARATPVARHSRFILPRDGGLLVRDSLAGEGTVEVAWRWIFGHRFERVDAQRLLVSGEGGQIKVTLEGMPGSPQLLPLSGATAAGWLSCEYGQKKPGLALCLGARVALPVTVETRFELQRPGALPL